MIYTAVSLIGKALDWKSRSNRVSGVLVQVQSAVPNPLRRMKIMKDFCVVCGKPLSRGHKTEYC